MLRISDEAEEADERGVLLQRDEVVQQRREDAPHRLRDHDVAQRLPLRQAERARGRGLAPVHALEPGAVHLGDVRAVHEHERERAEPEQLRVRRHVAVEGLDVREREAEADEVDHDDRRHAAEHVGVHDREQADRQELPPGKLAHDRDDERPDQHEHLGHDEQPHVPPEAAEQRGAARPDQRPLEQHAAHERVVAPRGRTRRTRPSSAMSPRPST